MLTDGGCHDGTAHSAGVEAALGQEEKFRSSGLKIGVRAKVWAEDIGKKVEKRGKKKALEIVGRDRNLTSRGNHG